MAITKYVPVLLTDVFVGVISSYMLLVVTEYAPMPYMDEVFHIPQAQKYCQRNFLQWDPKITTPPGLYLSSLGFHTLLSGLSPGWAKCSVLALRATNVVFTVGNVLLFYALTKKLNQFSMGFCPWRCAFTALNLATFPTLFFFTFLYYTDAGATFCVFLAYLLALHGCHWSAAAVGAVSLLFRQTNVVWVALLAVLAVKSILEKAAARELKRVNSASFKYSQTLLHLGKDVLLTRRRGSAAILKSLFLNCSPYLLVGVAFLSFVYANGGIVLGDRSAHRVTVHVPQLFYFFAFVLFFTFPISYSTLALSKHLSTVRRHPLVVSLAAASVAAVVAFNTLVHRYVLADNRHYTFYVWRKFLGRHPALKFVPVPLYVLGGLSVTKTLCVRRDTAWCLAYTSCVVLSLVPQELLEFRYFIVPFLMFRLQLPLQTTTDLILEFILYSSVNALSLYLFLEKPFVWPGENVLQRFMW